MEYVVGLKKELDLLNEQDAQKRYLELVAMGYKDNDIILATPVSVQVYLNIGQNTVAQANPAMFSGVTNQTQNTAAPGYPMSMPGKEQACADQNPQTTMATNNGEFDPAQANPGMTLFRNSGEPGPSDELPSDTIS